VIGVGGSGGTGLPIPGVGGLNEAMRLPPLGTRRPRLEYLMAYARHPDNRLITYAGAALYIIFAVVVAASGPAHAQTIAARTKTHVETLASDTLEGLARRYNVSSAAILHANGYKGPRALQPGQQLIKVIHELSLRPEFIGKIILLEGYDLSLARGLVSGVDVWLNTPEYPLEASGTSGEKAAINGAINLSVLDGWWGEGFNHQNGWAITPRYPNCNSDERNREEADDLLDIIEYEVVPIYYQHDGKGYSEQWVKLSKASMKSIIPSFNAQRMVMDYVLKAYIPAAGGTSSEMRGF